MRQEWPTEDLIGSWTLVGNDWQLVGNKSGATRLGFGLFLKFFELEARFRVVRKSSRRRGSGVGVQIGEIRR